MKNFTGFKYQESVLKTVEEPSIKKKFNWDRFSFILLLVAGFGYFGYSYYKRIAFTNINGLVQLEKMAVNFTDDIRLIEICTKEADAIKRGDTLFVYTYEDKAQVENSLASINLKAQISGAGDDRNFLRDIMNLKRQIAIKKSEIEGFKAMKEIKQFEVAEQKKQILMGVDVAHKLPPLKSEISSIDSDIRTAGREIQVLRKHLAALQAAEKELEKLELQSMAEKENNGLQLYDQQHFYVSPIAGVIGQINNSENEVCYKSENVMVIHQLANLKIKAYFETSTVGKASIGDHVEVEFPDGTIGRGIIDNFYISTYEMPPEFQKKYEPTERSVLADIVPINEEEAKKWIGYYKMAVKVVKKNDLPFYDFIRGK
jgi:multidrug resistance efflux pump